MGTLSENAVWEEYIYRIQTTDQILGGADGVVNVQAGQVANRTRYLYSVLGLQHPLTGHEIRADDVAVDAAIAESKIAFDVPVDTIKSSITIVADDVTALKTEVEDLIGSDGMKVESLSRALRLLWESGIGGFDWEFFSGILTSMPAYSCDVISTVEGDDTIIVDSTEHLRVGDKHLLFDPATPGDVELIEVGQILTEKRFLATAPVSRSLSSTGKLANTSWDYSSMPALAVPGSVYLSKVSNALSTVPYGKYIIRRDTGVGKLKVEYRFEDSENWITAPIVSNRLVDGLYEETYDVAGGRIQLRVTNNSSERVYITHMVLFSSIPNRRILPIRQPRLLSPIDDVYRHQIRLEVSEFKAAYGDNYAETEFKFTNVEDGGPSYIFRSGEDGMSVPMDDAPIPGMYKVSCRHISDIGDASPWSDYKSIYVREPSIFFSFQGSDYGTGFDDADFNSLKNDTIRFGFDGTPGTAGFDEALFILE